MQVVFDLGKLHFFNARKVDSELNSSVSEDLDDDGKELSYFFHRYALKLKGFVLCNLSSVLKSIFVQY